MNWQLALGLTSFAGLCTLLGATIFSDPRILKKQTFTYLLGLAAGAMIAISLIDLLPQSIQVVGWTTALISCMIGIGIGKAVDLVMPHIPHSFQCDRKARTMMTTGTMVAVGMIIHNIPEGMAVFMSTLHNQQLGTVLALATAIHNIPEGVAIAAPIICATNSRKMAFKYSVVAGLAEPFGAVLAFVVLRPFLSESLLASLLAGVAGIMLYITADELLPWCFSGGHHKQAFAGIISGIVVLGLSLGLLAR